MIEMGVTHDHMGDALLLFERERIGETTGIERNSILEKKTRKEASSDTPPGTTQDAQLHDSWKDGLRRRCAFGTGRANECFGRVRFTFTVVLG